MVKSMLDEVWEICKIVSEKDLEICKLTIEHILKAKVSALRLLDPKYVILLTIGLARSSSVRMTSGFSDPTTSLFFSKGERRLLDLLIAIAP